MLRVFGPSCAKEPIVPADGDAIPNSALWIDLFDPSGEEEKMAEELLGQNIPTHDEMMEIEPSSRLYERKGVTVMTMSLLHGVEDKTPSLDPVSFILTDNHLVTLRYVEPPPFDSYAAHVAASPDERTEPVDLLVGLLDTIVDRLADRLEEVGLEIERISEQIFEHEARAGRRNPELRYEVLMLRIGVAQRLLAKIRESAVSANRMLGFLLASERVEPHSADARHLKSLVGDSNALSDHSDFLGENLTFLLDASLGMIGLQQNQVMKIFSVVAVVLMPPTLIAGIYGMNFRHMPELDWRLGYPLALLLMLASAILPYMFARKRGWL